ncbi:MAG: toxic anion resistance protein [Clostridia bacterium]|nr:toxic anion resistance protein [Clostridia bacterium]MBR4459701.1 toxic anion resistance protein [Clostridia bacterium]
MAINFTNAASNAQQKAAAPAPAKAPEPEIIEVPAYDAEADRKAVAEELKRSPEIDALTATIDVGDMNTIVTFGAQSAEEIAKASDIVLRSISANELDEPSQLMNALAKVMEQFDINEIKENPGLFGKLFGNLKKQLDKILSKYQTMGDQVDKIYTELRKYEDEIKRSNTRLDTMFDANVNYFHELVKYIVAGEQGVEEITAYIDQRRKDYEQTGDNAITFEIQSLEQARDMLDQRVQDLRTAEIVAMQSIPMIRTMQYSNMNLVRKINSAFIVTLPVFKQQLAQAVLLKRQKLQAEAISALDERTNEMLLANARNAVETSKITTRLATGSSIKAETLEASWRTIVNGIEETRKIQESAASKRKEDKEKLEKIKSEFMEKFQMPEGKR